MTKKQLIDALSSAEQRIAELEEQVDALEKEKVHIGAKLLDDEQSNIVKILKSKIEDLEKKQNTNGK